MKLLFGSVALKHWLPDLNRIPKDIDYIAKDGVSSKGIEYHWTPAFQYIFDNNKDDVYVDLNFLYTIKISHAMWDVRWDKTMIDINFMKEHGCTLDTVLYEMLIKDWEIVHGEKKVKMTGNGDSFFTSKIDRKMDHDQLHEIVKWYDRPLHESIRKDLDSVFPSKSLWNQLSDDDKLKCASEEIFVFALERYSDYPPQVSVNKALKQLITSSTKGWFNLFLIDNYKTLRYNGKERYAEFYKKYKELKDE